MKAWLIYWCIGCAVVGFPLGSGMRECPNDDVRAAEVAAMIAVWPAIIVAAISGGPINRDRKCLAAPVKS